jgi:hypothetical protein
VDALFQAMFHLTDLRVLLRKTAPDHHLTPEQDEQVHRLLEALEKECRILKEELIR